MTTDRINATLDAGMPLESIGGYCEYIDTKLSIWTFEDDDFAVVIKPGIEVFESNWYSTAADAYMAAVGVNMPYEQFVNYVWTCLANVRRDRS